MTNLASAFQPAIDALEKDYADLERQANGLLQSINLLREKAGLPPRPGGWCTTTEGGTASTSSVRLHSDTFTGKTLGTAVRMFLEMRKQSGGDSPATTREIFDALKEGGYSSQAKDEATGMVILRTMLRKNTTTFVKLQNGKYGLRAWYPNLKPAKATSAVESSEEGGDVEDEEVIVVDEEGTATPQKEAAGS